MVSHDIQFLDKNINRVFDISNNSIKDFKGNISRSYNERDSYDVLISEMIECDKNIALKQKKLSAHNK